MNNRSSKVILIFGCLLFRLALANYCPNGAFDYGELGECILGVEAAAPFDAAQATCKALGGRLVQINSETENLIAVLAAMNELVHPSSKSVFGCSIFNAPTSSSTEVAQQNLLTLVVGNGQTTATIGIIFKDNQTRLNADGTPLNYLRFASADEYSKTDGCTVLNVTDFNWYSASCDTSRPFLCTFSDQGGAQCPSGWAFNDQTGKCYYIQNILNIDPIPMYNRTAAETLCQSMGAHLASIHSDAEDIFLRNLMASSRKDVMCTDWQAIIGATCSETDGKSWSDGSPFNYDLTDGECMQTYAIINDEHCRGDLQNVWDNWAANFKFARFICKKDSQSIANV